MRVAVTGGTGFVGCHTVAALQTAGHQVRLLVRSPDKVAAALTPVGAHPDQAEVVTADVLDRPAVAEALADVDAVVHAASVYSFDRRRRAEMERANDLGLRNVMEVAIDGGLDPIVHVSSTVALLRDGVVDDVLTAMSPVGDAPVPYSASKIRQEGYLRDLQASGAPVVITYPGGVYGPHDPHGGESVQILRGIARRRFTFIHRSGYAICDVRDLAAVHAAVIQAGRGPRRYMAGGHYATLPEMIAMVADHLDIRLPCIRVPTAMAHATGRLVDRLPARGIAPGVSREGAWISARRARPDNADTEQDLGVTFRPLRETVADQLDWMRRTNLL